MFSLSNRECRPTSKAAVHRLSNEAALAHPAIVENNTLTVTGAQMLHYAVVFFVIALIAAFFGFGGIAVGAASIAKILFVVFLIGAVITFLMSLGRRV
jgi:uncharacterized membrane protein YtjA (UPF0391 family)